MLSLFFGRAMTRIEQCFEKYLLTSNLFVKLYSNCSKQSMNIKAFVFKTLLISVWLKWATKRDNCKDSFYSYPELTCKNKIIRYTVNHICFILLYSMWLFRYHPINFVKIIGQDLNELIKNSFRKLVIINQNDLSLDEKKRRRNWRQEVLIHFRAPRSF